MNAYLRAETPLQNKRTSLRQSGTKREFTQFFLSFSSPHPPKPLRESVAAPARAPNILKESSVGPYQGPPTSSTTEGKKRYALVSTVAAASLFSTALAHIYITAKRKKQGEKKQTEGTRQLHGGKQYRHVDISKPPTTARGETLPVLLTTELYSGSIQKRARKKKKKKESGTRKTRIPSWLVRKRQR